jgi:hypothetical protein
MSKKTHWDKLIFRQFPKTKPNVKANYLRVSICWT